MNKRYIVRQKQNRFHVPKRLPNRELLEAIKAVEIINNQKAKEPEEIYNPKNGLSN